MFAITQNKFAAFALAATLTALPLTAQANDVTVNEEGRAQTAMAYGDLNLATAEGKRRLAARLERAADAVCGVNRGTRDLAARTAAANCRRDVIVNTMLRITPAMAANTQ